ncbi:MAG: zf-HC2 domain-containing protein [Burkholderiaceae bacterium]|nr:zf-HC2 domain-containing protein [Burkholderiaceae bacterium]
MIPCRAAHRLISEGMDRQLGSGERLRLRLHLGMCSTCTRIERQMGFLRQAMRRLGDG